MIKLSMDSILNQFKFFVADLQSQITNGTFNYTNLTKFVGSTIVADIICLRPSLEHVYLRLLETYFDSALDTMQKDNKVNVE